MQKLFVVHVDVLRETGKKDGKLTLIELALLSMPVEDRQLLSEPGPALILKNQYYGRVLDHARDELKMMDELIKPLDLPSGPHAARGDNMIDLEEFRRAMADYMGPLEVEL